MAALSREWKKFVDRYTADQSYWYVPKGRSITNVDDVQRMVRALQGFEGSSWRESQRAYIDALAAQGLSSAKTTDEDDEGIPMSRMLAAVFSMLGFAWVDENEAITLTPAGEAFISSTDPAKIVAGQSQRYQIGNPMAGGRATQLIEVHPVPYLLEVLLETGHLTKTEYILFCAKSKSFGDIEDSINDIQSWRSLGPKQQASVERALEAVKIKQDGKITRRDSIKNTVELNAPYALAFWTSSGVIESRRQDGEILYKIPRGKLPEANRIVKLSKTEGEFIHFDTKKDWMAFYGDPEQKTTKETALAYYTDTAKLDKVRAVLDEMSGISEDDKRKYLSMIVSEETVEDILERNMNLIEDGMVLIKRQLETEVGRIDLFARDKNGVFTIIELKKGKTEDDVFGQLSRYLGWCKKTKARTGNVRGIIIAKSIGKKLWSAVDGHATPVELMEYDLKMSIDRAVRAER